MCNVKQVPSCDNRTSLFPLRGTLTGSSSSYTSFSVRIIQLFFQTPFPPNFLHAFSQQEQKQTFALSLTHTHTHGIKRLFLSRVATARLVLMMTTGICADPMPSTGTRRLPKATGTTSSPAAALLPPFIPRFLPSPSSAAPPTLLHNPCSLGWSCERVATSKRSHRSPTFLEPKAYMSGLLVLQRTMGK